MEKKKHPGGCFFYVPTHWGGIEIIWRKKLHEFYKKKKYSYRIYKKY